MIKKKKPLFLKVLLLVIVFLLLEAFAFIYFYLPTGISGLAISDISQLYAKFYPNSKIFLIAQWGILVLLLVWVYVKNVGIHRRNKEVKGINMAAIMKKSKTNLDALYLLLKDKKELSLKTIEELFKIKSDLAIEWARILESGELVEIDYPSLGSPIVKIIEEEKVEGEETKEGAKKATATTPQKMQEIKDKSIVVAAPQKMQEIKKKDEGKKKSPKKKKSIKKKQKTKNKKAPKNKKKT